MADPVTTNKAFAIPIRGSDVGTWDVPINGDFTSIDSLLGAGHAVSLSSTNVTLSQSDANNLYFNLTGALLADVEVIFPAIGGIFVISNQTTGSHTVTVLTSAGGSTGVEVAQGETVIVYLDGTNAYPAAPPANALPAGTKMLFAQAAAPSGWTQVTTLNDYALRVVSGTGAGTHGTVGLSTFISDGALGHTLTLAEAPTGQYTLNDPKHDHNITNVGQINFYGISGGGAGYYVPGSNKLTDLASTGITLTDNAGGGAHTHALANLQYLDLIQASKN
jgi:hypothetical protein